VVIITTGESNKENLSRRSGLCTNGPGYARSRSWSGLMARRSHQRSMSVSNVCVSSTVTAACDGVRLRSSTPNQVRTTAFLSMTGTRRACLRRGGRWCAQGAAKVSIPNRAAAGLLSCWNGGCWATHTASRQSCLPSEPIMNATAKLICLMVSSLIFAPLAHAGDQRLSIQDKTVNTPVGKIGIWKITVIEPNYTTREYRILFGRLGTWPIKGCRAGPSTPLLTRHAGEPRLERALDRRSPALPPAALLARFPARIALYVRAGVFFNSLRRD
jgi:hypothetical protein